tara:strand:+ start:63 stop:566 length:504 start_codon:yes stop_codon:yes gene_type:complete
MKNIRIKISALIFLFVFFNNCGFKPMYKISESNIDFKSYSIIIMNEKSVSREIKEEIRKSFPSSLEVDKDYVIEINTTEDLDPLITNTDGTVAKYRVEIVINFKVKDKNNDSYLIEDMVRGLAQYNVETSEIESDDKKKRMIQTATNSAIQMMISKIQSDISITNDN